MISEKEIVAAQKAMAYDLHRLIASERKKGRETITMEEMDAMIEAYIAGLASGSGKQ